MERKERFDFSNQLSREKMGNMIKQTDEIYQHILTKLYDGEAKKMADEVANKTMERIIKKEEEKTNEASEKELYNKGYQLDDPFFLANFKAFFPLVKFMFYDKNVRLTTLKFNMKPIEINNIMRELVGGAVDAFFREFNHQGEEFYNKMTANGIGIDGRWKRLQTKGITRGVVSDIYANMKMAMKKKAYRKKSI